MKNRLLSALLAVISCLIPFVNFGQTAPNLGTASTFAFFTGAGAFNNTGASTVVTGDVGVGNSDLFNAFPPGTLNGLMVSGATKVATDVTTAYDYLSGLTGGTVLVTPLGSVSGQTLMAGIYTLTTAVALNGNLILDGDANAIFIIQINGALTTGASSNVMLTGGASFRNVYWQINGAVELGENSFFKGTILANGAISLLNGASLQGRGLTKVGAISLNSNDATLPIELIYFSAKKQDDDIWLHWATASEKNSFGMEVEKSFDAQNFDGIAMLKGAGTINEKKAYSYLDKAPFEKIGQSAVNTLYYRLKQIDFDGLFEYSKVISIVDETLGKPTIYPNPASNQIFINNIVDFQDFSVINITGETVIIGQINATHALDISKLATGYYFLNIQALKIKFFKN